MEGDYATVVGIFERQWRAGETLTVVSPGTQSRDFTHVDDIIEGVIKAAQYKEPNREWYLRSGVSRSILQVARMFSDNLMMIPERKGERGHSALINNNTNELLDFNPKDRLKEYIDSLK